jgi:hypothetical protein
MGAIGDGLRDHPLVFAHVGSPLDRLVQFELSRLLTVPKRTGPDARFQDPRPTCARMGFMKGQHPKCALEGLGHANVAFVPDERSRFIPVLGADEIMGDTPSGAPARATAAPLLPSPPSRRRTGPEHPR